jgi:hypothetical protein
MNSWRRAEDGRTIIHFDQEEFETVAAEIARRNEFFPTPGEALAMLEEAMHRATLPLLERPDHPEYNVAAGGAVFTAVRAINGRIYVHVRAASHIP